MILSPDLRFENKEVSKIFVKDSNIIKPVIDAYIKDDNQIKTWYSMKLELSYKINVKFENPGTLFIYNASESVMVDYNDGYNEVLYRNKDSEILEIPCTDNIITIYIYRDKDKTFLTNIFSDDKHEIDFIEINNKSMESLFENNKGLTKIRTPYNLDVAENVISMKNFCKGASNLLSYGSFNFNHCLDFTSSWEDCILLEEVSFLNIPRGMYFNNTWRNCASLLHFIEYEYLNGIEFNNTWENCISMITYGHFVAPKSEYMNNTWRNCTSLEGMDESVIGLVVNLYKTWEDCTSLRYFRKMITKDVTIFEDTWRNCASLVDIDILDFSSTKTLYRTWEGCSSIYMFPDINTLVCETMYRAWANCSNMRIFKDIRLDSAKKLEETWMNCSNLIEFPHMKFRHITSLIKTWEGCTRLETIGKIGEVNTKYWHSPLSVFDRTFYGCVNLKCLTYISFYNVNETYWNSPFFGCNSLEAPTYDEINTLVENKEIWNNPDPCYLGN